MRKGPDKMSGPFYLHALQASSPINECILIGSTTVLTGFRQTGILVAKIIPDKSPDKIKCDFHMSRCNTF